MAPALIASDRAAHKRREARPVRLDLGARLRLAAAGDRHLEIQLQHAVEDLRPLDGASAIGEIDDRRRSR